MGTGTFFVVKMTRRTPLAFGGQGAGMPDGQQYMDSKACVACSAWQAPSQEQW